MIKAADEIVILTYLKYRKYHEMGFLKYSNFCVLFCYIIHNYDKAHCRKLFIRLVRNGHFIKKRNVKRSYTYQYNPNPPTK